MDKKQIVLTVVVGASMFAAGFLARTAWDHAAVSSAGGGTQGEYLTQGGQIDVQGQTLAQTPQDAQGQGTSAGNAAKDQGVLPENIKVRVDDGEVQWFDGTLWHTVAAVEELVAEDRFSKAEEAFLAFAEQLRQEQAEKQAQEQAQQEQDTLLKEEGPAVGEKPTPKPDPKPQKKPEATPDAEQPETVPDAEEPVETPPSVSPGTPSAPAPTPAPTPQPTPPPPADTGDGEDMGWSDDYL